MDCLVDQTYRLHAVAAVLSNRPLQFRGGDLQESDRRFHVRLRADGVTNAEPDNESHAEKQPVSRKTLGHDVSYFWAFLAHCFAGEELILPEGCSPITHGMSARAWLSKPARPFAPKGQHWVARKI